MTIFPGQDIVFRRIGKFNRRHDDAIIATTIVVGVIGVIAAMIISVVCETNQNRKINYLINIDSVEYRFHKDENGVRELRVIYCTDQDGNRHHFPDMIPTVRAVEFEQNKRYIITTQGPSPRRITSAETVTADKWLENDQQKE